MQKSKTIQLGEQSFTVKELPMRVIWELVNNKKADQDPMVERVQSLVALSCPELTMETVLDLYPSEIEELWAAFQEVNAAFLGAVRRIGLFETLRETIGPLVKVEMLKAIKKAETALTDPSASLSSTDTAPLSGITATVSS